MDNSVKLTEKYERNGWPSVKRPDLNPPAGLNLSLLTSLERIRSHTLSSQGQIACIKDGESLSDVFTMSANGGWLSRITTERPLAPYWDDETPEWSPDGNWLAFGIKGHVHIVPRDGGLPKKITDFAVAASGPRWMPDSNGLIVTVERNDTDQLLLTDRDGSWPRALTTDTLGDHWDARPSPDGKFIVFNLRRLDDLNRLDIVLLEIATGKQTTLYGKPSTRAMLPKWSPDGQWISFISQETGREELYLIKPDGEGLHQLTKAGKDIFQYEWSPTGKQMLVVENNGGSFELMMLETESGSRSALRSEKGIHSNPNWAKDESFITFEFEGPTLPPDVYRMELPSKKITQLTFSNPPALQRNKFIVPEVVYTRVTMGWKFPHFCIALKNRMARRFCTRMAGRKTNTVLGGMNSRSITPRKATPTLRRIIAVLQAMARNSSAPITTTGALATRRIVCMAQNICAPSKTSNPTASPSLAEVTAAT